MDAEEERLYAEYLEGIRYEASRIPWRRVIAYAVATFFGATAGYGIGFLLFGCRP